MLTKDLVLYRTRQGKARPLFVAADDAALLGLAADLVAVAEGARGEPRDEVEEALGALAGAWPRPKVARGLVKLLVDRLAFDEPEPEVTALRDERLRLAARVLRALPPDASVADYEARLAEALPVPLAEARERLYADLPGNRRLLGWEALAPAELLERYNLALAQGMLFSARRLTVRARAPELLRVRKVLRWLKFCRLVAEVRREGEDWALEVEGPGAVLALQKKYGLQLASFLSVVPVLGRWSLSAEVEVGRRHAVLELDERDPLVSPHPSALGHVPPEVESLAKGFSDEAWELDLTPMPRHVGAAGLCVPDLSFRHRASGREVALELFHAWHAGPLARRLEELRTRPDPALLLGVDRALARGLEEREALEAHPQVVMFYGFPSARRVRERLDRMLEG